MQKDDDVEIPSLTLDQDEISDRGTGNSHVPKAGKQRLNPPPARPTGSPGAAGYAPAKKTSLAFVYFLLLLIVGGVGAGGYWLWMENQALRDELLGARSQIQDLDSQLVAADVSTNALGQTVEETLKTHDSEIRKLWAVAYDRNRTGIANNDQQIEVLQEKLSELREVVSTQGKRFAVQADAFNDIENGYNTMVNTVAKIEEAQKHQIEEASTLAGDLNAKVEQQGSTIGSQRDRIADLDRQLSELKRSLSGLDSKVSQQSEGIDALSSAASQPSVPSNLSSRLQSTEEAIRSIDQFRPQVLREINNLKSQVRQMSLELSLKNG